MSRSRTKRSLQATKIAGRRAKEKSRSRHSAGKTSALVRKHWPEKGRAERVARAKKAWQGAMAVASTFKALDSEIIKQIAENPDLEYL